MSICIPLFFFDRLEKQKSIGELRHLEYVLQKGVENLDGREAQIAKQECELERQRTELEQMRVDARASEESAASLRLDLQEKKKVGGRVQKAMHSFIFILAL